MQLNRKSYFGFLILPATDVAKAASATTPVLPLFLMGAFGLPQAEEVEGFTAHLAENKLKTTSHKNTFHNFYVSGILNKI